MAPTWPKTVFLVLPAASVGFGFFVFLFSVVYSFGPIGLQTTYISDLLKQCKEDRGTHVPFTVYCKFMMNEMAAGIIGFLFGLIQIGIGAGMYKTKEKGELYKIWALANGILLLFILPAGFIPLHVYTAFTQCGEGSHPPCGDIYHAAHSGGRRYQTKKDECTKQRDYDYGQLVCFLHAGCNQLSITNGNGVVLCYGIIAILDAIFILASVGALLLMDQAASISPSGYHPPSSAAAVKPTPSKQLEKGSVAQTSQSQTLKVPPTPKMSKMARPPG